MALCAHPTITSNLTPEQAFDSNTGIVHALLLGDQTLTVWYGIIKVSILLTFTRDRHKAGYDVLSFTLFYSEAAWTCLHTEQAVLNTISVRLREKNTQALLSQASLISTSPAPTTSPAHSSPWNKTVDPTTALIALMQQSLQKNATMIAQLNSRQTPHSPQP